MVNIIWAYGWRGIEEIDVEESVGEKQTA